MNRRHVLSWALFDFGGSMYSAVIAATVFQVYYISGIVGNEAGLGDLWWGRVGAVSVAFVAITSPLLGSIADRAGIRKRLMILYTAMGVGAVASFTVLEPGMVVLGFVLAVVANVGFEGGLVFYNAYLPDIATRREQGRVSGWGFALGYAGSAIGLLLSIPLANAERFDLIWLLVAGWWTLFSLPAFLKLPEAGGTGETVRRATLEGIRGFRRILGEVWAETELRKFLLAFFFYIDGVLTVIWFASSFAERTLGFEFGELILLFLVVQIAALAGALALSRPTDLLGPKKVVSGTLVVWTLVGISAFFVTSKSVFFGLAVVAGSGLGAIQAASRSFMAALIPEGKEAEMFGFYAFAGKTSSILGPLTFGTISALSGGNQRVAVLAITGFFLVGGLLLQRVHDPVAAAADPTAPAL